MDNEDNKVVKDQISEAMIIYGAATNPEFFLALREDVKGILNPMAPATVFDWIEEYYADYGVLPENYHHLFETKRAGLTERQDKFVEQLLSRMAENFDDVPFNVPLRITEAKQFISGKRALQLLEDGKLLAAFQELNRGLNPTTKPSVKDMAPKSLIPVFPAEVMGGAAGRFAKAHYDYTETPGEFLYMNYLTMLGHIFSGRLIKEKAQPRIFTVNLGESANTRKSSGIILVSDFFRETNPDAVHDLALPGSAEGLARALKETPNLVLIVDEFKALIGKMKGEGSVLLPWINSFFESNHYANAIKKEVVRVDGIQLSVIAASTLETFQAMFDGRFKDIGFDNRFFLVIGKGERRIPNPKRLPNSLYSSLQADLQAIMAFVDDLTSRDSITAIRQYDYPWSEEAKAAWDTWYFGPFARDEAILRRLDAYGQRLMVLMAVNEQKEEIDQDIVERVIKLLDYQEKVRKFTAPIIADSKEAALEQKIRKQLEAGLVSKRELEKSLNKWQVGVDLWNKTMKRLGVIEIPVGKKKILLKLPED